MRIVFILAAAIGFAHPAKADRNVVLSLLPLKFITIETTQMLIPQQNRIALARVKASTQLLDIDVDGLQIDQIDEGYDISFNRLTIRERENNGQAFQTSGTVRLNTLPGSINHESLTCRYADSIISAELGETVYDMSGAEFEASRSTANPSQMRFEALSLSQKDAKRGCTFDGFISGSGTSLDTHHGTSITADMFRLEASAPLGLKIASEGGETSLSIRIDALDAHLPAQVPLLSMAGFNMSLSMASPRSAGILYLIESYLGRKEDPAMDLILAEMWNAYALTNADIAADFREVNMFLPSISPKAFAAPYGRGALSYVMGSGNIAMSSRFPEMTVNSRIGFNGLFDLNSNMSGKIRTVARSDLTHLSEGSLSLSDLTLFSFEAVDMSYSDLGLDSNFKEIFGLPIGRFIEEITGHAGSSASDAGFFSRLSFIMRYVLETDTVAMRIATRLQDGLHLPRHIQHLDLEKNDKLFVLDFQNR